jgi:hypothetical protein
MLCWLLVYSQRCINWANKFWFFHDDLLRCVGTISRKYALDRPVLPSLWHVQARTNVTQIEVMALEEASFLLFENPKCPLVDQVGDNNSTPINQPFACTLWNLFGDGPSAHVYKPSDPSVWPKTRNGKKICHPSTFKLSILQKNKWEVGWTFEATLLTPSNILLLGYGWIYHLLLGLWDWTMGFVLLECILL